MKKSCILLILLLSSLDMNAVMADGIPRDVIQSDGSLLTLCQYGDENFHFLMTQDGFVVKESEKGGYYYAFVDSLRLLPTTILAHNPKIRNNNEKQYLKIRLQRKYDDCLLDILREITTGATNKEISEKLYVSPATVNYYINDLLVKTGYKNRVQLAVKARLEGLVISDDKTS